MTPPRSRLLTGADSLTDLIAGPVPRASRPAIAPPPGACDCHAHIFGPSDRFPYTEGRGYTPPDAPLEAFLAMLDAIGCDRAVVVQGNAHGTDNRAILDAVTRQPKRLRGICITDTSVDAAELRRWHAMGIRGLRFHVHLPTDGPAYRRGVGLDVLHAFLPTMQALGWHAQIWCDWRTLPDLAPTLRTIARELPIVIDHMLNIEAGQGVHHPSFQSLLKLLGDGQGDGECWVKLSGASRISDNHPHYPDARPFHDALIRTNPDRLVWGTDWPHPQIPHDRMPDDGKLMDLFAAWTPDAATRQKILVDNPARLYGFDDLPGDHRV